MYKLQYFKGAAGSGHFRCLIMEINKEILNVFQAASIILVFVTLLFGVKYPIIVSELEKEFPLGKKAINKEKKRLRKVIIIHCIPQLIIFGLASYLFTPLAVKVLKVSTISFWNFDFLKTAYIFSFTWCWTMFFWSLYLALQIVRKIKRAKL